MDSIPKIDEEAFERTIKYVEKMRQVRIKTQTKFCHLRTLASGDSGLEEGKL